MQERKGISEAAFDLRKEILKRLFDHINENATNQRIQIQD